MDFTFQKDFITRQVYIEIDAELTALARFIETELGTDMHRLEQLQANLMAIMDAGQGQYRYTGQELSLLLSDDEIQIVANSQLELSDTYIQQHLQLDESLVSASCGLDDFLHLLQSWSDFI